MRSSPSRDTETANGGTAGRGTAPARRSRPVPHSEPLVCPKPRTSATRTHAARAPTTAGGRRARTRWHRRWQCSPRWWGGIVSTRTGSSANGGAYHFELGYDARSSGKFAGIFPIVGSPHAGFVRGLPNGPVPLLAVWGHSDTTMPPCYNGPGSQGVVDAHTGSADTALDTAYTGHFYSTARNATSAWAAAAGCTAAPSYDPCNGVLRNASEGHSFYPVASDTIHCVHWSGCEMGVEVIECIDTRAGHWSPSNWHDEIWAFMQRSIRPGSSRNGPG